MTDEYFDDLRINNKDALLTTPKYKHALPTLGMAGWVTDLAPAADFLFSYYFFAKFSPIHAAHFLFGISVCRTGFFILRKYPPKEFL